VKFWCTREAVRSWMRSPPQPWPYPGRTWTRSARCWRPSASKKSPAL